MTPMLKLSVRKCNITMINMLRTPKEKVVNVQEQMDKFSREVYTLRRI